MPRPLAPSSLFVLPILRAAQRRSLRAACVMVTAALVAGLAGCDEANPEAAEASRNLREAIAFRDAGDPQYEKLASDIASVQNASDATIATANAIAGDASMAASDQLLSVGSDPEDPEARGLVRRQSEVIVLADRMRRMAGVVVLSSLLSEGQAQARDGLLAVVESLRAKAQQVRGNQAWAPEGVDAATISVPGVEQVEAQVAQIQSAIEQKKQQLADLESARRDLLTRASQREEEGDLASGQESIDAAREVADLRNDAAVQTSDLDNGSRELRRLEDDLQLQQALLAALEQSATALEEQARIIAESVSGEGGLQSQLDALTQRINSMVSGQSAEASDIQSLSQLQADLNASLGEVSAMRDQVIAALQKADASYGAAAAKAGTASTAGRSDGGKFGQTLSTLFTSTQRSLEIAQASARRRMAEVHLSDAVMQSALMRLMEAGTTSDGGSVQALPADLAGGDAQAAYEAAVRSAASSLADAELKLAELTDTAPGDLRIAVLTERAVVTTAMHSLRSIIEATGEVSGVTLDSEAALQERAAAILSSAESSNIRLPIMPMFSALAGVTPPPLDDDAPAGEPGDETTQPATNPDADPESDPETDPDADPEADPETDPETDPEIDPSDDPSK